MLDCIGGKEDCSSDSGGKHEDVVRVIELLRPGKDWCEFMVGSAETTSLFCVLVRNARSGRQPLLDTQFSLPIDSEVCLFASSTMPPLPLNSRSSTAAEAHKAGGGVKTLSPERAPVRVSLKLMRREYIKRFFEGWVGPGRGNSWVHTELAYGRWQRDRLPSPRVSVQ